MSYRSWLAQLIKDDGCCQSEAISYLWANPNSEDVLDYFASYFDLDTVRLEDVRAAADEIYASTQAAISRDFPNEIQVWRCGNLQGDVTSVTTDKYVAERGCKGGYYGGKDSAVGSYMINRSDVLVSIEHFWPYGDFVEGELLVRPSSLVLMKESLLREYIRELFEANEYGWEKANRKTMGQDGKAKGRRKKNWLGQNTNDEIVNWYKKMGLAEAAVQINEGVEFREVDSPLKYGRSSNVKRIALCDNSVSEPAGKHDSYFAEIEKWRRSTKGGRRLKEPVLDEIIPGVSDICIIGFLDYHSEGTVTNSEDEPVTFWYIDYMKTRGDKRGQGSARQLVEKFYETVTQAGDYVNFGKMMQPQIGHLKDDMVEKYPEIKTKGAEYF